jgi:hypothetical protein
VRYDGIVPQNPVPPPIRAWSHDPHARPLADPHPTQSAEELRPLRDRLRAISPTDRAIVTAHLLASRKAVLGW